VNVDIVKGFMHFFKKGESFIWDDHAQCYFEALKKACVLSSLLSPPNYSREFLLYLTTYKSTIGMVLVQEDESHQEHVIYYLSKGLVGPKLRYPHIEKLALATIHAIQALILYAS
jgi:hypothetical protein